MEHSDQCNEQLRLCQIIASFSPRIGGAERATERLCKELVNRGHNIDVVTTYYGGLPRHEVMHGFHVWRMGIGGPRFIRSASYTIHSIAWIVLHSRRIQLFHTQNLDSPTLIAILSTLLTRHKWITTIHGEHHIPSRNKSIVGKLRLQLMKKLAVHYISISTGVEQTLRDIGVRKHLISSIPNGLDLSIYTPIDIDTKHTLRRKYNLDIETPIILYLGRLIPSKNVALLLEALRIIGNDNQLSCLIVGDGNERNRLEDICNSFKLNRCVRFVGMINDVIDYYHLSDIFVLPSLFEGLPVALIEAMACGVAPIASECTGNLNIVRHGVTGLTFPINNAEALASQLVDLLASSQLRTKLALNARKHVEETYGIHNVATDHLKVYFQVL